MNEKMKTAADYINAEHDGLGWRYYDPASAMYWRVNARQLRDLAERLEEGESEDTYSEWCADTDAEPLGPRRKRPTNMVVPPECAGQIVEVSYSEGYGDEAYKCVYDASDRSVAWFYADTRGVEDDDAYDPVNRAPKGLHWEPCVVIG